MNLLEILISLFSVIFGRFSFVFSSTGRRQEELMTWRGSHPSMLSSVRPPVRPLFFLVYAIKFTFLSDSFETCKDCLYRSKD